MVIVNIKIYERTNFKRDHVIMCEYLHTEAHTHKHTCTISTQQEWRQPGTGAWLREAEERLCERPCTHKHDIHESERKDWSTYSFQESY